MTENKSRYRPPNLHWYEDLPERTAPEIDQPDIRDDFLSIHDASLELSRASSLLRGPMLATSIFSIIMFSFLLAPMIFQDVLYHIGEAPFVIISTFIFMLAAYALFILFIRIELSIPSDMPVRFNRAQRKVFIYHRWHTWNPFGRWPASIKEFDWDTVHAELTKQAGFSGKVYMVRYAMFLVSCKPGTTEVVERVQLKGNVVTTAGLRSTWAYCRHFMEFGREGLPEYPVKEFSPNFWHSLFFYMPWFDPTSEGRLFRRGFPAIGWFIAAITAPLFWILLPFGLCHYLIMRVAPRPHWPPDVDARSRSA